MTGSMLGLSAMLLLSLLLALAVAPAAALTLAMPAVALLNGGLVFLAMRRNHGSGVFRPFVTAALILVTSFASALTNSRALDDFALTTAVYSGEIYRLISYGFVHYGALHLETNMFTLWVLGNTLGGERLLGRARFVLIYGVGMAGSALINLLFLGPHEGAVGASGAIMALLGAMVVGYAAALRRISRARRAGQVARAVARADWQAFHALRRQLLLASLITFAIGFAAVPLGGTIDNVIHVAGFGLGLACGLPLLRPSS